MNEVTVGGSNYAEQHDQYFYGDDDDGDYGSEDMMMYGADNGSDDDDGDESYHTVEEANRAFVMKILSDLEGHFGKRDVYTVDNLYYGCGERNNHPEESTHNDVWW